MAVSGVSFQVEDGEFFALLGPNGAGKTTTLEVLEGYRRPDIGRVRVLGLDPVSQGKEVRRQVGVMLQDGGLYPSAHPRELLDLFASFYPDHEPPAKLVEELGLESTLRTPVRRLSVGQRQRLSLALALIGRPRLLFLDEPTAGMDPHGRQVVWALLRRLHQAGTTIVLTTHYLEEAERLAQRVGILDNGRLVALDHPSSLATLAAQQFRFRVNAPISIGKFSFPIEHVDDGWYVVKVPPTPERVRLLAEELSRQDALLTELRAGAGSLEQAYLTITGKEMEN